MNTNSQPIVLIYDGQCDFCIAWQRWLQKELEVTALSFQDADLSQYGLTPEECSKSIFVITPDRRYAGAVAIVFLLHSRGDRVPAFLIRSLGPIGRFGYRWIARHRNSRIIKYWTEILKWRLNNDI